MDLKRFSRLVIGVNSVWQRTLVLTELFEGKVNRAEFSFEQASGKGINVVQAFANLGIEAGVVQFAGGVFGDLLVRDMEVRSLLHVTVRTTDAVRVCTTILDKNNTLMTELIEPSPRISQGEKNELCECLERLIPAARMVALCGTVPAGIGDDFYAGIVNQAQGKAWVLLDSYREVEKALAQGPDIVKINVQELLDLTGVDEERVAVKQIFERFPVGWLAITNGKEEASFHARHRSWYYSLPQLENVINPLGAGDTATAAILMKIESVIGDRASIDLNRDSVYEDVSKKLAVIFRFALAAASASCIKCAPAAFDAGDVQELEQRIKQRSAPSCFS